MYLVLIDTVYLSTHNICFGWEIRKIIFHRSLLTWNLINVHAASIKEVNYVYPHAFLKKAKGILQSPLSVRLSVMLSPPKPLDDIQPNLVSEQLTWMGRATANFIFGPPPGALGRGQKVKYHLISITKSISKIFIPNIVCVLTNERYKIYQTGFSFCPLGHAPGVGLMGAGVPRGSKKKIFSNIIMWHIKSTGMTSRTECK